LKKISKETKELKKHVIDALLDVKAENLVSLDLRKLDDVITDFFIICHGNSNTQVNALSDAVFKKVKDEMGLMPKAQEGKVTGNWVILDYFDIVVHVFHKEAREYYQLEELWSDAKRTEHK